MGYRHYLSVIQSEDVRLAQHVGQTGFQPNDISSLDFLDIFLQDGNFFCFGGRCETDLLEDLKNLGEPLFGMCPLQEFVEDESPILLHQDGLIRVIDWVSARIFDMAQTIKNNQGERAMFTNRWLAMWTGLPELCVQADCLGTKAKYRVTGQDYFDMSIFNLVHVLKMVDWEKDAIVLYGW